MVNRASIVPHVAYGYARVAEALGVACQWYRAAGPMNPVSAANSQGTLQAFITTDALLRTIRPSKDRRLDEWYGAFDTSRAQVGDILVSPAEGTYFIAAIEDYASPRLVRCNRVASILTPPPLTALGVQSGYGGDIAASETLIASGWPCAVMQGSRGETGDAKLPSDVKMAWAEMLFPLIPGAVLANDVRVVTDDGVNRLLSSVMQSAQMWRCTGILADG